jgi:hypothetical protein
MNTEQTLRNELAALLRGGNAHEGFEVKVAGFPAKHINSAPPGVVRPPSVPFTPWDLLEHMRIAQWDILGFIKNPNHESPDWPGGYWPEAGQKVAAAVWEESLESFRSDLRSLTALAENPDTDLFSPIPHAPGYTILRELLVAADHNSYHIGQFGLFSDILANG